MIDVREAVHRALQFIRDMYAGDNLTDVRLEEVEKDDVAPYNWHVTIGFRAPGTAAAVSESLGGPYERDYKVVKIDADTGQVLGMTMRQVQS